MTKIKQKIKKRTINRKEKKYFVNQETYRKRFLVLGVFVVALFVLLAGRLYQVMLRDNTKYKEELTSLAITTVEGDSTPRGRILDRNGKVIVDNKAVKMIYYEKDKDRTTEEEIELAYTVSSHLSLGDDHLSDAMKRTLLVVKN